MTHPATLLAALETRARKRFGQHFLASPAAVERIVALAQARPGSRVLEVGPGLGVLTEALLEAGAQVVAVELDRDLAAALEERLSTHTGSGALRIVQGDALAVDLPALLPGSGWTTAANLPYNAGTQILIRMLALPQTFGRLVVMLQREVVDRLLAGPGDRARGSLSVYAAARATGRLGFRLPPGAFYPPPRVESAVAVLELKPEPETGGAPVPHFDTTVRLGFSAPRKTLRRVFADAYDPATAEAALQQAGVDPKARPADLDLAAWGRLALALPERP